MARRKLRSQAEVVKRARTLQEELAAALAQLPSDDPAVVDAVWRGEALGTLLWALQLAELRYRTGIASSIEVLEAQRSLFDAELGLSQAQLRQLAAAVQLYRALGGSWPTTPKG